MSIGYRLWQLVRALTGQISPAERALVVQQLTDGELLLFERMAGFDQRHCLDVYHTLVQQGYTDLLLLRAALLHDCGKVDDSGSPIPLCYYGLFVVLQRFAPHWYTQAVTSGRGLLRPFRVHATHEARAAWLAEQVGSPPEVVAILRDYSARRPTQQTLALKWADEQN